MTSSRSIRYLKRCNYKLEKENKALLEELQENRSKRQREEEEEKAPVKRPRLWH
jgi:hypothetical protein